jgi:hypothetical protein
MSLTRKMARRRKRNEVLGQAIMAQAEAFRQKFGREPTEGDPLFFDDDADVPTPISEETLNAQMLEAMRSGGIRPELIYAWQKTGLIATDDNWDLLSKEDQRAWNVAMKEYFAMEDAGAAEPAH